MKQPVEKGISLCTRSVWQLQQIIASNVHCSTVRGITTSTRLHLAQCCPQELRERAPGGEGHWPGNAGGVLLAGMAPPASCFPWSASSPQLRAQSSACAARQVQALPGPAPPCRRPLLPLLQGRGTEATAWKAMAWKASLFRLLLRHCSHPCLAGEKDSPGTFWKPPARCPSAVPSAPWHSWGEALRRHGGARAWRAGRPIPAGSLWRKPHCL